MSIRQVWVEPDDLVKIVYCLVPVAAFAPHACPHRKRAEVLFVGLRSAVKIIDRAISVAKLVVRDAPVRVTARIGAVQPDRFAKVAHGPPEVAFSKYAYPRLLYATGSTASRRIASSESRIAASKSRWRSQIAPLTRYAAAHFASRRTAQVRSAVARLGSPSPEYSNCAAHVRRGVCWVGDNRPIEPFERGRPLACATAPRTLDPSGALWHPVPRSQRAQQRSVAPAAAINDLAIFTAPILPVLICRSPSHELDACPNR